jgi:predicted nucleotidyltransferase
VSELGYDRLLRDLAEAEVEFVVIGALALGAWGVVRATKDVDIVADPDPENLKRVAEIAVAAGGHVQRGEALLGSAFTIAAEPNINAAASLAAQKSQISTACSLRLASGEQVAIETDLGRLDVVQGLKGVPLYKELRSRASEAEVLGVTVAVCSVEDLRKMKRAAGRTRDLADLEDLDAAGG